MAIYHLHTKFYTRKSGVSVIARVAYRSGSEMEDRETGQRYDYHRKKEVVYSEIILCGTAPLAFLDRSELWSAVQRIENRKDSMLAREVEVALPAELPRETQIEVLREFIHENFTDRYHVIADYSIHDKDDGNPHAHILLTRPYKNGHWAPRSTSRFKLDPKTGEKIPVIDPKTGEQKRRKDGRLCYVRENVRDEMRGKEELLRWRKSWADINNRELSKIGASPISEKAYQARGLDDEPTIHEGFAARKLEKQGGIAERCEHNRRVRRRNGTLRNIRGDIRETTNKIKKLNADRKRLKKIARFVYGEQDQQQGQEIGR